MGVAIWSGEAGLAAVFRFFVLDQDRMRSAEKNKIAVLNTMLNTSTKCFGKKNMFTLMIFIDPDDFRFKNHDFSASGPNRLVYVIEAVQKLEISVFRKVHRADRFFMTFLRFL